MLAELLDFEWALMKTTSEDVPTVCKIEQARRARRNLWIAMGVGVTFLAAGLLGGIFLSPRHHSAQAEASTAEPLAVLSANAGTVWSTSFDRVGDTVAMAVEKMARVRSFWDLPTKSVKATLNAHRGVVWSSRFTPGGEFLVTAGDDRMIKLWKPPQQEPLKTFKHANAVRGLAFAHDGKKLFAGDRGGGLRVWSFDAARPLVEAQQPGAVYAVALSPNDETLATAGSDKVVRLWNAKTLTQKLRRSKGTPAVRSMAWRSIPMGTGKPAGLGRLGDRTVRIWDAGSGLLHQVVGRARRRYLGSHLFARWRTSGHRRTRRRRQALGRRKQSTCWPRIVGHQIAVHTVAFNRDGTLLASGGRDGARADLGQGE